MGNPMAIGTPMVNSGIQYFNERSERRGVWSGIYSYTPISMEVGRCMATIAAFPSTIMEAAFGRLHNSVAGAFGAGSTVIESMMVDG